MVPVIHTYTPDPDSVIEPNVLDMLPPPRDCNEGQRAIAIGWYAAQPLDKLREYLENTMKRIHNEYYSDPKKKFVGQKLYNLYAMRDIIHEAMRHQGVPTRGGYSPNGTAAIYDIQRIPEVGSTSSLDTITPNYIPLQQLDVRSTRPTATS